MVKVKHCGCSSSYRCPVAEGLWESANAIYRVRGYDAWIAALSDYHAHNEVAGL